LFGCGYKLESGSFPILQTKYTRWRDAILELLAMINCRNYEMRLSDFGRVSNLWKPWAEFGGGLGSIYTHLRLHNMKAEILEPLVESVKSGTSNRRLLSSGWLPMANYSAAIPPCHHSFQVGIAGNKLNLLLSQRSADIGLGLPYNVVAYAFLQRMLVRYANHKTGSDLASGSFSHSIGDAHVYENHVEALRDITSDPPEGRYITLKIPDTFPQLDGLEGIPLPELEAHVDSLYSNYDELDPQPPKVKLPVAV
jgi:thymidylate synthase